MTKHDPELDERFLEKLDRVSRSLSDIEQRFQDALARDRKPVWENWMNGDFAVALILGRFGGGQQDHITSEIAIGEGHFVPTGSDPKVFDLPDLHGGDKHVVLVELVELGKGPEEMVSAVCAVRLDFIKNEIPNLGEGALYRRLINPVYQVLPRFVEGESREGIGFPGGRPIKGSPDVIQGGPEVMDRITKHDGDLKTLLPEVGKSQGVPTVRIARYGKGFVFSNPEVFYDGFKLIDVAYGPFDL